jgi:hypothetical protein
VTKKKPKQQAVKKAKRPVANKRPVSRAAKKPAKKAKPAKPAKLAKPKRAKAKPAKRAANRWLAFVAKHGVVLASARGPLPNIAEAVAGEPIVGSWWAHPKGKAIFAALCEIDDSPDIRCFKLVDGKVTFAHRTVWPALVRLGHDGVIAAEQLGSLQQEHMPTGEHRNFVTPFPDWVDDATARAAEALSADKARARLAWLETT